MNSSNLPYVAHAHIDPAWLLQYQEDILEPDLAIVDAHHHLWDRGGAYFLDELLQDTDCGHKIVATVFLQCGHAYRDTGPEALRPVGETEFVAAIAQEAQRRNLATRVCAGIIGTADLALGEGVEEVLQAHVQAGAGRFRGIRHITARHEAFDASFRSRPPAQQMADREFRKGFARLAAMGLTFDAWLYHPQIAELTDLARAFPQVAIVLNHVGGPLGVGPYRGDRNLAYGEWLPAMRELALCPNVHLKLGGLGMTINGFDFHQRARPPSSEQLAASWRPYLETSIALFGVERCMFESNFPVDKGMFSYAVLWNAFKRIASGASAAEKAALFHGTASRFYRLD